MLTDILEVPSLMDICLRSGSYDDALDLKAFISKIAVLQPDLPVSLCRARFPFGCFIALIARPK